MDYLWTFVMSQKSLSLEKSLVDVIDFQSKKFQFLKCFTKTFLIDGLASFNY